MNHRNPFFVLFFSLITLGIYGIVWQVKTKNEMKRLGAEIPTAWLIIVPFVNWWWLWKYSQGVDKVTKSQMSTVIAFILLFVLGVIGMAIIQDEFNKVGDAPAETPATPVTPAATPDTTQTPPATPPVV